MTTLSRCVNLLAVRHGGIRPLARAAGLDASYVLRLRTGEKSEPSDETLAALGLTKVVAYKLIPKGKKP